jgi:hypothetical protein
MRIDHDYARETLVRLIRTNFINPTLAPGAPGEREIGPRIGGEVGGNPGGNRRGLLLRRNREFTD